MSRLTMAAAILGLLFVSLAAAQDRKTFTAGTAAATRR